jgi:hypothetical protein
MPWRLGPCCPSTARPPHRVEIGVEGRKVEVGVLCCFQRLFDTRGFGGDGVAEFAEHEAVVVPALLVIRKDRPLLSRCPQAKPERGTDYRVHVALIGVAWGNLAAADSRRHDLANAAIAASRVAA